MKDFESKLYLIHELLRSFLRYAAEIDVAEMLLGLDDSAVGAFFLDGEVVVHRIGVPLPLGGRDGPGGGRLAGFADLFFFLNSGQFRDFFVEFLLSLLSGGVFFFPADGFGRLGLVLQIGLQIVDLDRLKLAL